MTGNTVQKNVKNILVEPDGKGNYHLTAAFTSITKVDIADVDIIIQTKDGGHYILPDAGIEAMTQPSAQVVFSDTSITVGQLFSEVESVANLNANIPVPSTFTVQGANAQQQQEQQQSQDQGQSQGEGDGISNVPIDLAASIQKLIDQVQAQNNQIHSHLFDFITSSPPSPPPSPPSPPPGSPPVISGTPRLDLSMGNITTATTFQPADAGNPNPGYTVIYGSGGDTSSGAAAFISERDPLQFSAAQIAGTATGNNVIYAEGAIDTLAGLSPAALAAAYATGVIDQPVGAKQLLLTLSGAYRSLNAITFEGVPAGVTIAGAGITQGAEATDGTYSWSVPSSYIANSTLFEVLYNTNQVSGTVFNVHLSTAGIGANGDPFSGLQTLTFEFLDAKSVADVTNPYLGSNYVLQTQDQPNNITAGDGNNIIYGSRSNDTVALGNGSNQVYEGSGNDSITVGGGANTILGGDGNDTVTAGNGGNVITLGNGVNSITSGTGSDTITFGNGATTVNDAGGNNVIVGGHGDSTITTGAGSSNISVAGGGGAITTNAGTGNTTITINSGTGATDTYSVVITGTGTTNITGGDDNYNITTGTGDASVNIGYGIDTIITGTGNSYVTVAGGGGTITTNAGTGKISDIDIASGTGTVAGADTYLINLDGVGSASVLGGNDAYIIDGSSGTGNDTVTLGVGNDSIVTGAGDAYVSVGYGKDSIITGTGNSYVTVTGGGGIITTNAGTGKVSDVSISSASGSKDTYTLNLGVSGAGSASVSGGDDNYNITTGTGDATVNIGKGVDTIATGSGNSYITITGGGGGTITTNAGTGKVSDVSISSASGSTDTYTLNLGVSGAGSASVSGGDDNYNITTGTGDATVNVGKGIDTISTGSGNSYITITGGGGGTITTNAGTGKVSDVSISSASGSKDTYTLNLGVSGAGSASVSGGDDNYNITTGTGDATVNIGKGSDTISTGLGNSYITITGGGGGTITTNAGVGKTSDITLNSTTGSDKYIFNLDGAGAASITGGNDKYTVNGATGTGTNIISFGTGSDSIITGTGSDSITLGSVGSTVASSSTITTYGGGGTITAYAGAGNTTIVINSTTGSIDNYVLTTTGTGTTNITGGDDNYTINGANGAATVSVGAGNDSVTTGSTPSSITLGDGNSAVNSGTGSDTVTIGDAVTVSGSTVGGSSVTLAGGNDSVSIGDGNHAVSISGGNDTITLGDADSLVGGSTTVYGSSVNVGIGNTGTTDSIVAGSGNNAITVGSSTTTGAAGLVDIYTGSGNDSIAVYGGKGTIYANDTGLTSTGGPTGTGTGSDSINVTSAGIYSITAGTGITTIGIDNASTSLVAPSDPAIVAGTGNITIGQSSVTDTNAQNVSIGGAGQSTVAIYTTGNITVNAAAGSGSITTGLGSGTVSLTTGSGTDTITVGSSTTTGATGLVNIYTGSGNDTIAVYGGRGTIYANDTGLTSTGGPTGTSAGSDSINVTSAGIYSITAGTGITTIGIDNASTTIAAPSDPVIVAGTGNITIGQSSVTSTNAQNVSIGGSGQSTVAVYTTGAITISEASSFGSVTTGLGTGNVSITTGSGNDTISVGASATTLATGNVSITTGNGNNNILVGSSSITAATGLVNINTGTGNDTIALYGGHGAVTTGGSTENVTVNSSNAGGYSLTDTNNGALTISVSDTVAAGSVSITAGGAGNEVLTGTGAATYSFTMGTGLATVTGGTGANSYHIGASNVTLNATVGGAATVTGHDTITTGSGGSASYYLGAGSNVANANTATSSFFGTTGTDTFNAGTANSTFTGGSGADTFNAMTIAGSAGSVFYGGSGKDTFYGANDAGFNNTPALASDTYYGGTGSVNDFTSLNMGDVYYGTGTPTSTVTGVNGLKEGAAIPLNSGASGSEILLAYETIQGGSYAVFSNSSVSGIAAGYSTISAAAFTPPAAGAGFDTISLGAGLPTIAVNFQLNELDYSGDTVRNSGNAQFGQVNLGAVSVTGAPAGGTGTQVQFVAAVPSVSAAETIAGNANGALYGFTTQAGANGNLYSTINEVVIGQGLNQLDSSLSNSVYLSYGNNINDEYTTSTQTNIIYAEPSAGTIDVISGAAQEIIVTTGVALNSSAVLNYQYNTVGLVINLTGAAQVVPVSGKTVNAYSGANYLSAGSYANGDLFVPNADGYANIESITLPTTGTNIVYTPSDTVGGPTSFTINSTNGTGATSDWVYGTNSQNVPIVYDWSDGANIFVGSTTTGVLNRFATSNTAMVIVLSKTIATSSTVSGGDGLTIAGDSFSQTGGDGLVHAGFAYNGTQIKDSETVSAGGTVATLIDHVNSVFTGSGNDLIVADNSAVVINADVGTNTIYGGTGADTIDLYNATGTNTVYVSADGFSGSPTNLNLASPSPSSSPAVVAFGSFASTAPGAQGEGFFSTGGGPNDFYQMLQNGGTNYDATLTGGGGGEILVSAEYSQIYDSYATPISITGRNFANANLITAHVAYSTVAGGSYDSSTYTGIYYIGNGDVSSVTSSVNNVIFVGDNTGTVFTDTTGVGQNIFYESAANISVLNTTYNAYNIIKDSILTSNSGGVGSNSGNELRIPGYHLVAGGTVAGAGDPFSSSTNNALETYENNQFTGISILDLRTGADTYSTGTTTVSSGGAPITLPVINLTFGYSNSGHNVISMDAQDIINLTRKPNGNIAGAAGLTLYLDNGDTFNPNTTAVSGGAGVTMDPSHQTTSVAGANGSTYIYQYDIAGSPTHPSLLYVHFGA